MFFFKVFRQKFLLSSKHFQTFGRFGRSKRLKSQSPHPCPSLSSTFAPWKALKCSTSGQLKPPRHPSTPLLTSNVLPRKSLPSLPISQPDSCPVENTYMFDKWPTKTPRHPNTPLQRQPSKQCKAVHVITYLPTGDVEVSLTSPNPG